MTTDTDTPADTCADGTGGPSSALTGLGAGFVLLGGLVAAVTGPLSLERGSWLAAYLVLVCGAAQYAIGHAPRWLGRSPEAADVWTRLAGWNAGNLAVVVGTLATAPYVVDAGGIVLLVVLALLLREALRRPAEDASVWGRRWYAAALVVLVVSVPVGLALAHLRAA